MAKKKKVRVELRKNRNDRPREQGWTRDFQHDHGQLEDAAHGERVRAKGEHSRHRTIIAADEDANREIDASACRPGRVLRVHRDVCIVQADDDGREIRCAVRWLLRSLSIESRTIVTTGDRVWYSIPPATSAGVEGVIERVEPRHGMLTRASRHREHVIVANVDQVVIVVSLVEPELKVHLIDRFLASAAQGSIKPLLCLNKADRVSEADYQGLLGTYNQLGIPTLLTSARTGKGVDRLRDLLRGKQTVFSGQSGVGKSSLLNAIEPELGLRVREVSEVNSKGRHTTTHADLIRLHFGGWVVDTPGVRQFSLWSVAPGEVEGYFPEFRPLVPLCGFRDCTHTHEERCAIKRAVHRREISALRYTSYIGLYREMSDPRRPTNRANGS
jgi:ribosome biogenesis GTPase